MARGESAESVARRFAIHPTTAGKWRRLAAAGRTTPQKVGAKPVPTKLTDADIELLEREVTRQPGITLKQLMGLLSVSVAQSTVCRTLRRLGFRYKKRVWQPASD